MASDMVCSACGHVGKPIRITPGSFGIEVVLWLFICVPGLIYSIWRHGGVYDACSRCQNRALIPSGSPVGTALTRGSRTCPFCAEAVQPAAIVCKHCGRDLPPPAPELFPALPPAAPSVTEIRLAEGTARNIGFGFLAAGFVLSCLPYSIRIVALLLFWIGGALLLVKGPQGPRLFLAGVVALLLFVPSTAFYAWRGDRQEQARQKEQAGLRAAASRAAAEKAKAASDSAARSFPDRRASIEERVAAIEGATKSKDWAAAQQRLQELQVEVTPLFASTLGKSSEVVAIKNRLEAQQTAVSAHARQQQAADAAKRNAEAARAAAEAEKATRAAWKPDPIRMSITCARFAKQGIIDGEATFSVGTLTKSGKTYSMQGQVMGHNAFNARIAKRAVCKVYMDMKDGKETYTTTLLN